MKHGKLIRIGVAGLLGGGLLVAAFQAGRLHPVRVERVVEKEIVKVPVPTEGPVVVPIPVLVTVPNAVEFGDRARQAAKSPLPPTVLTDEGLEVDPNLCVQHAADGGRVMWIRKQDRTGITQYDFAADGSLSFLTNTRIDSEGNPLGSKIYNGQNELLYKASYGYNKHTGALVAEVIFDEEPRIGPDQRLVPVRRVTYATGEHAGQVTAVEPDPALAENGPLSLPSPFSSRVFPRDK